MKLGIIILIFSVMFLVNSEDKVFGNVSEKNNVFNLEQISMRDNEEISQYDSYMILYFKEDCNYSGGFINKHRKNISFIVNRENGNKLTSEESLIIHKDFGIEIHFNSSVRGLQFFFDSYSDNNMEYLLSIDLDNFDSSLVTNMEKMFYGCLSLISISLSNLNTSNLKLMHYIFYGCRALESIDLDNFDSSLVTNMEKMFHGCLSLKSISWPNIIYYGLYFL